MGHDLILNRSDTAASPASAGVRAHLALRSGIEPDAATCDWHHFDNSDRIAAWDALAQDAAEPNPFFESWYLLPALENFDPEGRVQLFTLEADGQLAGLMPIRRELSYYGHPLPHLHGWTHANCFLGQPLVARGFERAFWRALLRWADEHAAFSLFLHLSHMPAEGALKSALAKVLAEDGREAATVLREERALLQSSSSPQDYFEDSLSTKKRKELRRQHRRLGELGDLQFERIVDESGIAAWSEEFLSLEKRGWKGSNGSALACDPRTAELFKSALSGAAHRGRLERLALRLDGTPIAMLANFQTPPGAFSFKTTFDEQYARYSPGVLLQQQNLGVLDNEVIDWVDSCAAEDHPMIDHIWRERRAIARFSIGIGGTMRRAAFNKIIRFENGQGPRGLA